MHKRDTPRHPAAVRIRRIYDPPAPDDGHRVLVDRLWPRGVSKERAQLDEWAKELAPSDELRRWFHAAPEEHAAEFTDRYRAELDAPEQQDRLAALRDRAPLTLLTATKDAAHSHAAVLLAELTGP
ncbi:uncharacterized protein YeaO (DUF488 family) [Kitasatospora sp. MAA4]|uniref:DUF488 domain-containing protein n=1 Tax=Kitasatospora sp. MAA4 TaxID=3035093 RepID=UPI0024731CC3|nr:DUF488 family protein [Kitasatospora sp. MAA4]MDH6135015.1 uncharacterized protein YeaO (DUF488 family) [Kitasatospora sp. MAA4]